MHVDFPQLAPDLPPGLIMELGVAGAATFNFICKHVFPRTVYGFDWFHGLPEAWPPDSQEPGLFSLNGQPPAIGPNGELIIGKIEDTLKPFLAGHRQKVALVHFDLDLYAPTKFALDALPFQSGSVLAFDEITGEHRCTENEQRAFWEWFNTSGHQVRFLGQRHWTSWVVQIK